MKIMKEIISEMKNNKRKVGINKSRNENQYQ